MGTVFLIKFKTSFLLALIFLSHEPPSKKTLPGAKTLTLTFPATFLEIFFANALIAVLAVEYATGAPNASFAAIEEINKMEELWISLYKLLSSSLS